MSDGKAVVQVATQVLSDEQARDAAEELGESLIKVIFSEDVAGRVPMVKSIVDAVLLARTLRDTFLERKLRKFVSGLSDISKWELQDTVSRLEADPSYSRRVGEHLVELMDRIDSHRKPLMVAAVFAAYAKRQIDVTIFNRLLAAIEALPSFEIDTVRRFSDATPEERLSMPVESLQTLVNGGFATAASAFDALVFDPNATCKAFVDLNLDRKSIEA